MSLMIRSLKSTEQFTHYVGEGKTVTQTLTDRGSLAHQLKEKQGTAVGTQQLFLGVVMDEQ